jgi:hypothetical protein
VNKGRRRLARAGLGAPAVLGMLASRPVLGNSLHNCTPSGHISGFASPNPNGTVCSTLGKSPSHFAGGRSTWPDGSLSGSYFINNTGGVRLFKNAPWGAGLVMFKDAYQTRKVSGGATPPVGTVQDASVWDVLKGCNVNVNGTCNLNWVLEAKSGFNPDITLGAEAVAALMNALTGYPAGFPISPQMVVTMFNNVVVSGGLDQVTSTATWNAAEVKEYFQSLHA